MSMQHFSNEHLIQEIRALIVEKDMEKDEKVMKQYIDDLINELSRRLCHKKQQVTYAMGVFEDDSD